ncbi:MAG: outer membrane lipoprotein LolB [Lentisphaeria bacterium]|jgi:outer membrane lipoprotein LolB
MKPIFSFTTNHWSLRGLTLIAILATAACTNTRTQHAPPRQLDAQTLMAVTIWNASGKLGIKIDGQSKSVNFDWANNADTYAIHLNGPLGVGAATLQKQGANVTLATKNAITSAHSAEDLLQQNLGWSLPVSELVYWIKGLPSPVSAIDTQSKFKSGELSALKQQGWQLVYSRYETHHGFRLPGKIVATHDRLKLTLVIKNWRL